MFFQNVTPLLPLSAMLSVGVPHPLPEDISRSRNLTSVIRFSGRLATNDWRLNGNSGTKLPFAIAAFAANFADLS